MEKIKVLHHDWGYPVCQNPKELQLNLVRCHNKLIQIMRNSSNQFVGTGSSGAMLLGAMSYLIGEPSKFILLRKPEDSTSQGQYFEDLDKEVPIIILDDHIMKGRTMENLALEISRQHCILNVVGVIAQSWDNDNPEYVAKHEKLLADYFPSIKFWMY